MPARAPRRNPFRALALMVLCCGLARAEPLAEILATGAESAAAAQQAQLQVERIAADAQALAAEERELRRQIDGLARYNARLERQAADQQSRIASIAQASAEATVLAREMVPLLERMTDSLEAFVALDRPFLLEERRARIAQLRADLDRADVPLAAVFRAVLAAYRSEIAYGEGLHAHTGYIEVDGSPRAAELLRVGRLALFAQSRDGATTWHWDDTARRWAAREDVALTAEVRAGLAMARGERPRGLLLLPVPGAEDAE